MCVYDVDFLIFLVAETKDPRTTTDNMNVGITSKATIKRPKERVVEDSLDIFVSVDLPTILKEVRFTRREREKKEKEIIRGTQRIISLL